MRHDTEVPTNARTSALKRAVTLGCAAVVFAGLLPHSSLQRIDAGQTMVELQKTRAVYARSTGIVEQILVASGDSVAKGQLLARLDATELAHKIETAELELRMLAEQRLAILYAAAGGNLGRLAERRQTELKALAQECELRHLRAQFATLEVRAQLAGRITTEDTEALVGRMANAGEPLFHLAPLQQHPGL